MKSVMAHNFSVVPRADIPRSQFNRSHGLKTTFDAGYLIPVFADEALPGDTMNLRMTSLARMATPIVPIMDNIYLDTFFFAVPMRLIWDNWHKFNGAQDNPGDSTSFTIPTMDAPAGGHLEQSLSDYLGIPTKVATLTHNSCWHRAYNLIWNEWFRDQNLQNSVTVDTDNGPDTSTDYALLRRGKRHDYFTSALPWLQKATAVTIPLGTTAPVKGDGNLSYMTNDTVHKNLYSTTGASVDFNSSFGSAVNLKWGQTTTYENTGLETDLSAATAATINALRQSFQLQKLYERDARGGTRLTEIIRAHFGVISPDARLQRPEFLGGNSTPIHVTPIAQTSSTDATTPQGNLAAFATSAQSGAGFFQTFTEHCVLLGLVSARADLTYQQGLDRMFSRQTREDFYWPALSQIGEQSILNKEIYADASANDELVFGYQERYAEYRYKPSKITGLFRSNATGTLEIWHCSEDFASLPALNASFIEDNPPIDRNIATPTEPHFIFDAYFDYKCARPMPLFGVPGNIDRF
jgi:hypothetical protein